VRRAIDWVHRLGGDALFVISGGRDGAAWEAAARAYGEPTARLLPEASAAGIRLAIEVIHPLRQDLSFRYTLADAREVATACRPRGRLRPSTLPLRLGAPAPRDHPPRRRAAHPRGPDLRLQARDDAHEGPRAAREGHPPLREIFRALERGGYRGWYEVEIISDDVDTMGYERVLRRTRATVCPAGRESALTPRRRQQ
jgi:sugar phosphate isomerase/epimerase